MRAARTSLRYLKAGSAIPTAPSAWSSGTSTGITRRRSTFLSAPTNSIALGAGDSPAIAGSRRISTPDASASCFEWWCPRIGTSKQKVIWTLTSHGKTDQAKGWLQPRMGTQPRRHRRKHGRRRPRPEQQASVHHRRRCSDRYVAGRSDAHCLGHRRRSSETVPAHAFEPDRDAQPRRPRGVQIKWIQYRGPGKVTFDPEASAVVYGEPVALTSKVRFSTPGTYVLRATANDGQLFTSRDVTVNVSASASAPQK